MIDEVSSHIKSTVFIQRPVRRTRMFLPLTPSPKRQDWRRSQRTKPGFHASARRPRRPRLWQHAERSGQQDRGKRGADISWKGEKNMNSSEWIVPSTLLDSPEALGSERVVFEDNTPVYRAQPLLIIKESKGVTATTVLEITLRETVFILERTVWKSSYVYSRSSQGWGVSRMLSRFKCELESRLLCPAHAQTMTSSASELSALTLWPSQLTAAVKVYSGYGKYSDPFKMFTLFHRSHLLKSQKFILFLINVTQHPILTEKNRNVEISEYWILVTMWYFSFSFLINLQKCLHFCLNTLRTHCPSLSIILISLAMFTVS